MPALIRYPSRTSHTEPSHHLSTYRLATLLSIPLAASWLLFLLVTRGTASSVLAWETLPNLYLLFVVLAFVIPIQALARSGRYRTLSTLKRVSIGGLAKPEDGKFGDILMADVLTSYAKVFGDLFVALCMFFTPGQHSTARPDRSCGGTYIVPFVISVPYLIRLRQCLIEYLRVRKSGGPGWGGQHLANAAKYASAFPVIVLSALQRGYDPAKIHMTEAGLFRLWYVSHTRLSSSSEILLTSVVQAPHSLPQFFLLFLLGRGQRLGLVAFLEQTRARGPGAPLRSATPSVLSQSEHLLLCNSHGSPATVHLELEAEPAFGPLQRPRGWDLHDGAA